MENGFKSLLSSRTFWSASLALAAVVATSFHLTAFAAWAVDPHSLDVMLNGVSMVGMLGAMVFRSVATKQITSILPTANPAKVQSHWLVGVAAAALFFVGGCANLTTQQQANLQAELQLGDKAVQVTKNLYCLYEPVTAKIIGVFDTSSNTTTLLAKLDTATALICAQAQSAMVGG